VQLIKQLVFSLTLYGEFMFVADGSDLFLQPYFDKINNYQSKANEVEFNIDYWVDYLSFFQKQFKEAIYEQGEITKNNIPAILKPYEDMEFVDDYPSFDDDDGQFYNYKYYTSPEFDYKESSLILNYMCCDSDGDHDFVSETPQIDLRLGLYEQINKWEPLDKVDVKNIVQLHHAQHFYAWAFYYSKCLCQEKIIEIHGNLGNEEFNRKSVIDSIIRNTDIFYKALEEGC
jgi:hypothetical protein